MSGKSDDGKKGDPARCETRRGVRAAIAAKKPAKADGAKGGRKMNA
jgi:hypothetical protein